MIKPEDFRR